MDFFFLQKWHALGLKGTFWAGIAVILLFSTQAVASRTETGAMRCNNGLVQKGDTTDQVEYACGEPVNKTSSEQTVNTHTHGTIRRRSRQRQTFRANSRSRVRSVEKWSYDVGGGVIHVLTFEGGILKSIHYFRK